ncbi:MAG TPA: GNAT family N-acetyltransferase [Longimicrobium sp.]
MILRMLTADDAAAYQALRLRGLRESPSAFGSSYEEEVDRPLEVVAQRLSGAPEAAVVGAFGEDGALAGIGAVRREPQRKARHRAGIFGMYVAPEARGRGVGRALLRALVDHARSLDGVDRLELGVESTNAAARALYLAVGFTTYGVQPDAYRDGERAWDAELMTMALREAP